MCHVFIEEHLSLLTVIWMSLHTDVIMIWEHFRLQKCQACSWKSPVDSRLTFYLFDSYLLVHRIEQAVVPISHFNNVCQDLLMSSSAIKLLLIIFCEVENWIKICLLYFGLAQRGAASPAGHHALQVKLRHPERTVASDREDRVDPDWVWICKAGQEVGTSSLKKYI